VSTNDPQKISQLIVRDYLIDRTTDELRGDARFIAKKIEFRPRDGEPNWDANIGLAELVVLKAFGRALVKLQRVYDIDW
jgi:hypothetical protein